jgi:hypothetical protein
VVPAQDDEVSLGIPVRDARWQEPALVKDSEERLDVLLVYRAEAKADLIQDPLRSIELHVVERNIDEHKRLSVLVEDGAIEIAGLNDG